MKKLESFINKNIKLINKSLKYYLPKQTKKPVIIHKAMHYSVFAGGKRLRPLLLLTIADMYKKDYGKFLPAACAIELLHTYSLIHDDLPCMDDDDYRRGKLTNHKVYGENIAVLAGDALLTLSFKLMTRLAEQGVSYKVITKIIDVFSEYSGVNGMLGGQVLDIIFENKKVNIKDVQKIHLKKTAALITVSLEIGALIAGVSEKKIEVIRDIGKNAGLAFQIVDDVLDITKTTKELGKSSNSDLNNNKSTYPSVLGIEKSIKKSEELLNKTLKLIDDNFSKNNCYILKKLIIKLVKREF